MGKIRLGGITEKQLKQKTRKLAEIKLKSLHILRTTSHLSENLREKNIQEVDIEDILEMGKETEELDIEKSEDSLTEDDVGEEDEDVDYDETKSSNLFDIEYISKIRKGRYIAEVEAGGDIVNGSDWHVQFLQVPIYETDKKADKKLIRDTLFARYKLFYEMASFIAERQSVYFSKPKDNNPANLNQVELVNYLRKHNISKEHVSRMLNVLYFRVRGIGDVPSKYLFERYGYKTGLNKEELLRLAKNFLEINFKSKSEENKFTRLDEAKMFREFIKKKTNREIELSDTPNEHDRYKNIKNILNKARKAFKSRHEVP